MGLNEAFGTIHTQIIGMDSLPSLAKVYSLIHQEEKHLGLIVSHSNPSELTALIAKGGSSNRFNDVHSTSSKVKPRLICDHCGKLI